MTFSVQTSTLVALSFMAVFVSTAPTLDRVQGKHTPLILSPQAGNIWPAGSTQLVQWVVSDRLTKPEDVIGQILLSRDGLEDYKHPLADVPDLFSGKKEIVVPSVDEGNDYAIVLYGNSGEYSQQFTITNPYLSQKSTMSYSGISFDEHTTSGKVSPRWGSIGCFWDFL